jgi:mandelate racemase
MTFNHLTLRSVSAAAVTLLMKRPLGTSPQSIDRASLPLVDPQTEGGAPAAVAKVPPGLIR